MEIRIFWDVTLSPCINGSKRLERRFNNPRDQDFLGLLDRRRLRHTASYPAGPESSVAPLLKPHTSNDGWIRWNDIVISERLKNHTTRHRRNKQWPNVRQDYHQGTFLKRMRKTKKCLCRSPSQDLNPNTT